MFEQFPYTNFHDLNLDWLIQKVKEAYSPDNPPQDVVISVNGETGEVILYKDAIVRLPDIEGDNWNIFRITDGSSEGIQFKKNYPAQRINGTHRYDIYDQGNPPPYPVASVNGQTGNVVISIPVTSVNGQTGAVTLYQDASIYFPTVDEDTWSMLRATANYENLGIQFEEGQPMKRIDEQNEYEVYDTGNPPPYPVTSVNTLTGAIAILDTSIVTDQGVQKLKISFPVSSVDGMTGIVKTWANSDSTTLKTPTASDADVWGLVREVVSGDIGIRFEYDDQNDAAAAYIYFDDGVNTPTKIKLLTNADIPSGSGVVSINGQTGAVTLYGSDISISSLNSTKIDAKFTALDEDIVDLDDRADDAFKAMAPAYSASATYAVNDLVTYNDKVYRCTTAISTAEAWTPAHWSATNMASEISTGGGNVPDMTGATSSEAGAHGLVPAPAAGDDDAFLKGDGTWSDTPTVNSGAIANLWIPIVGNKTAYASGASTGQFVYVTGSTITDIVDGLYTASKTIPYDTVIDKTYFNEASPLSTSGGGLNALNDQMGMLCIKYPDWDTAKVESISSLTSANGTYTVTKNGFIRFIVLKSQNANASEYTITINDVIAINDTTGGGTVARQCHLIPVSVGDVVKATVINNIYFSYSDLTPVFIPAK